MKGCEAIIESLKKEGVDKVFGYPGGAVIDLYDTIHQEDEIQHILTRHEQAAAHAADGYARVTGEPGVCIATSGPGATNLVTGIATAHMDSAPLIALTGQVPTHMIGNDAFQEADITGITIPITKYNSLVKDPKELPKVMKKAFYIASTGRNGPVLLDLPKDVQQGETDFHYPENIDLRGYKPTYKGHPLQIKKASKAIMEAERPVLYVGGGVIASDATKQLTKLAEKCMIPVVTTLTGKGAFNENHPLSLGMVGMHGTKPANYAVTESDLIIAVGARFDDRVTGKLEGFAPNATVIHIDIDAAEISKNIKTHIPIVGDAKNILKDLNKKIDKIKQRKQQTEWHKKTKRWKKEHPLEYDETTDTIKPQYIVKEIDRQTPDNTIIATEVGQCQMWAAQYYQYKQPRTFITSGGLGTMGYGLPAAIGAQVAYPKRKVWNIAGDGSIQMNIQELATAVKYQLPVNIAILNNKYLGMVRQWQELFYDERYSETDLGDNPDFQRIAEGFGALGITVTKKTEVPDAIERANNTDRPVLIDFHVDREENVYPMVPAGATLSEIIDRKDVEKTQKKTKPTPMGD
ncbi:Acetolactate synthase large subunit [Methanonatronarchaeum thermophilum]|uniref:Acetolactate synthase n=1 Tax=Methanonatronarchaeum thermophilum TaxID=1927129 RepID=A0A1Y3GB35_9EURY|nr:biosynthetic-type acetolactate synthase large subunit [Methanonatronarchaeum thermophilum]OUJ18619.1 Acetolactate synthase large subunit [Methanonatronarchaeum thermophilum]